MTDWWILFALGAGLAIFGLHAFAVLLVLLIIYTIGKKGN